MLAGLHREACFHGVFRARHQLWLGFSEVHYNYFTGRLQNFVAVRQTFFFNINCARAPEMPEFARRRWLHSPNRSRSAASKIRILSRGTNTARSPPACREIPPCRPP